MGRLYLIDLGTRRRFVCRACYTRVSNACSFPGCLKCKEPPFCNVHEPTETHIAYYVNAFTWSYREGPNGRPGVFVHDPVNLIIDKNMEENQLHGRRATTFNVYCVNCCDLLGWQVIQKKHEWTELFNNFFVLDRTKLYAFDGTKKEETYSDGIYNLL